ncbi:hypothetical protein [Halorubrum halophilum]|uniref:hypothetical protein n=1 Tax=Halorubrum halophilum TaxID=413816 RepID=UPI000678682A|nr:hypothetical protein [Halorubrum halophilum]
MTDPVREVLVDSVLVELAVRDQDSVCVHGAELRCLLRGCHPVEGPIDASFSRYLGDTAVWTGSHHRTPLDPRY